jgi:hypothetical protein
VDTKTLDLNVKAGGGWIAHHAQMISGSPAPIVLVHLIRGSDAPVNVRVDVDRRIYIDPVPPGVTFESSGEIVDSLVQKKGSRAKRSW